MSAVKMTSEDVQQAILQCEQERCAALVRGDIAALEKMLTQDLVHIHANGQSEGIDGYLNTVAQHLEFLSVDRKDLRVRAAGDHGDVAVATGELHQSVRVRATGQQVGMRIVTTQVWQRSSADGVWRQSSFHATNLA